MDPISILAIAVLTLIVAFAILAVCHSGAIADLERRVAALEKDAEPEEDDEADYWKSAAADDEADWL